MFDPNTSILVIDDMGTMRKMIIKTCEEIGFSKFTEAADGAIGWEALNAGESTIGLVVSDWDMPNCTGIDLLRRVRSDSRFKTLPFFLVTEVAEKSQILEAAKLQVSGYIVKPFTVEAFKKQLSEAYKRIHG